MKKVFVYYILTLVKSTALIIAMAFAFASCKKESSVVLPPAPTAAAEKKMVKETRNLSDGTTETNQFTFDEKGKITASESDSNICSYSYPATDKISRTQIRKSNNAMEFKNEIILDASGRIIRNETFTAAGATASVAEYTYNANGYMTSVTYTNSTSQTRWDYIYTNGNCTSAKQYINGTHRITIDFTLDETKTVKANQQISISASTEFQTKYGKVSPHPFKERKLYDGNGNLIGHYTYVNEINAEGYLIKSDMTDVINAKLTTYHFEYQ